MSTKVLILTSVGFLSKPDEKEVRDTLLRLKENDIKVFIAKEGVLTEDEVNFLEDKGFGGFYYGGLSQGDMKDLFLHLAEYLRVSLDEIAILGTEGSVIKNKAYVRVVGYGDESNALGHFYQRLVVLNKAEKDIHG